MRKTISLALVFAMLLSLVAFAPVASAANALLDIDFEDCATNADVQGKPSANGASTALVTDPTTGSKVMAITAKTSVNFNLPSAVTSGNWVWEFDAKTDSRVMMNAYDGSQIGTAFGICGESGDPKGYFETNKTGMTKTGLAYSGSVVRFYDPEMWHHYKFIIDATNRTVQLYVDDVLTMDTITYTDNASAAIRVLRYEPYAAPTADTVFYVDNIVVREDKFELKSAGLKSDNSAIELNFSHPVAASCLNETYFALTKDGAAQSGYSVSQSGTTVTLTPAGGLGEEGTWGLTVAGMVAAENTDLGTLGEVYETSFELAEPAGNIKFDWDFENNELPVTFAGNAEIVTDDITGSKALSLTTKNHINAFDMSGDLPGVGIWEWSFDMRSSALLDKVKIYDGNVGTLLGIKGDIGDYKIIQKDANGKLYDAYTDNSDPKGTAAWHNHRFVLNVTAANAGTYDHYVDGVLAYSSTWSGRSPKLIQIQAASQPDASRIIYFDNFSFKKARLEVKKIEKDEAANAIKLTFNTPVAASCINTTYFQLTKNGAPFNGYTVAQTGSVVTLTVAEGLGTDNTWAVTVPKWTTAENAAYGTMRSLYEGSVTTAYVDKPDGTEANVLIGEDYEYASAEALKASLPTTGSTGDYVTMKVDPVTGSKVLSVDYFATSTDGDNKDRSIYLAMPSLPNSGKWEWSFDMKANASIERFKMYNTSYGGGFGMSIDTNGNIKNDNGVDTGADAWTTRATATWHNYRFCADMEANQVKFYFDNVLMDTATFDDRNYNALQFRTYDATIDGVNGYIYIDNLSIKADHIQAKALAVDGDALKVTMGYEVADSSLTANHFKVAKNGAALAAADYTVTKSGNVVTITPAAGLEANATYTVTVSNQVKAADATWGTTVVTKALSVTIPMLNGNAAVYNSAGTTPVDEIKTNDIIQVKGNVSNAYTGHTVFVALYEGTVLKYVSPIPANAIENGAFATRFTVPAGVTAAGAKIYVFVWDANFKPLEAPIQAYPNR